MKITMPTLLVDEKRCRNNIRFMADKARTAEVILKPHFKTHQSHQIGRWFRDEGVSKITCSSLTMAKYFIEDGWNDITVAFPVNVLEMETINELASKIQLNLLVESEEAVRKLNEGLRCPLKVLIKLDVGTNRTGIATNKMDAIHSLVVSIEHAEQLSFGGFLAHAGHSYRCRSQKEILAVHDDCVNKLESIRNEYPDSLISYGDTPTCSHAQHFGPIDEIRPGNFAFYDIMQEQIGSCADDQISVAMACPVVAKHPDRNEVVIYGGGVHFSKDSILRNDQPIFGQVVTTVEDSWGAPIENAELVRVSQEHGVIHAPDSWIDSVHVGDIVKVLPVHSCMTMDLMKTFHVV